MRASPMHDHPARGDGGGMTVHGQRDGRHAVDRPRRGDVPLAAVPSPA